MPAVDWTDLAAAFALYLVLEGLMPLVNPRGLKLALSVLQRLPDSQLRVAGLAAVLGGLALLWFVRH